MSIYEGTRIAQEYAHGRDEGRAWGERLLHDGRAITHDALESERRATETAPKDQRAYHLGWLRGFREAVRTLRNGRWGT